MFRPILEQFTKTAQLDKDPDYALLGTKYGYEFTMYAFAATDGKWYAIVENPDDGRYDDMRDIIQDEFKATLKGWCVLKDSESRKSIIAKPDEIMDHHLVTYDSGTSCVWLLSITKPKIKLRRPWHN